MDDPHLAQQPTMEDGVPLTARHGGGHARLSLVARGEADLEPISPELALVDPELAQAARAALPDPPWAGPFGGQVASALRPSPPEGDRPIRIANERQSTEPEAVEMGLMQAAGRRRVPFDTPDRRLRGCGITLTRRVRGGASTWKLRLARGEVVKARATPGSDEPPAELAGLLRGVVGPERLVPVPWYSDDPDFARLQGHIWAQRDALLRHEPGTRLGADPENLHQFRVAIRRLRASLRTGRKLVDRTWAASLRAELARLGRVTGPVRDLDVLLEWLERELARVDSADLTAGKALVAELTAERQALQEELLRVLDGPDYLRFLGELEEPIRAAARPSKRGLTELAAHELHRLVEDVREVGGSPDDTELHRLRITVKRVRYAFELTGAPTSRHTMRVVQAAKGLQDLLGAHQDTVVAERQLREVGRRSPDAAVSFVAGSLVERQRGTRERISRYLPAAWRQLRRTTHKRLY